MAKFNIKQFDASHVFICVGCGANTNLSKIGSQCEHCGHHLFRVARRSGIPAAWDIDSLGDDPYLRQKRGPVNSTNDGKSPNLSKPGDISTSGFGTNQRDKGAPTGVSEFEDRDEENNRKLPSEETNLDVPPYEPAEGFFADPIDPLSSTQQMNREMSNPQQKPINKQLAIQRNHVGTRPRLSNIFEDTRSRLKGV